MNVLFYVLIGVAAIGLLIIAYARHYLAREDNMGEFFTYLLLNDLARGDEDQARDYHERLAGLCVERGGQALLPENIVGGAVDGLHKDPCRCFLEFE